MNNISYYNSDRLIFWKILGIKIINLKKEKKEKFPIFKTTYSLGPLQVKKKWMLQGFIHWIYSCNRNSLQRKPKDCHQSFRYDAL